MNFSERIELLHRVADTIRYGGDISTNQQGDLELRTTGLAERYQIHPEKEAIHYLVGKVEKELKNPAKHLQIEFNAIIANFSHEWLAPHQTVWINKTFQ